MEEAQRLMMMTLCEDDDNVWFFGCFCDILNITRNYFFLKHGNECKTCKK